MRTKLAFMSLFMFGASCAFAQTQPPATSCGPANVKFDTKLDDTSHSLQQPDPGKAMVYVIEVFQRPPAELGTPTIRVGSDGVWVGANRGTSYLSFSVDPGEHHLCTNWQSVFKRLSSQHSLTSFTAEVGKTYFFRVQTHVEFAGRDNEIWYIDLQPVNADEGKYLVASSPMSMSQPKK